MRCWLLSALDIDCVQLGTPASCVQAKGWPLLTEKRSLENYFHPAAIFEASGIAVDFGDEDDGAELVAGQMFLTQGKNLVWKEMPSRSRRRRRHRAKRWLNTLAVADDAGAARRT
jgi:hypothetical protein